jgi:predicted nucleic acid-binding protein
MTARLPAPKPKKRANVRFVDTNVLLYAVSREDDEQRKAQHANEILDNGDIALSAQVLQEFYYQATRDSRRKHLTHEEAMGVIDSVRMCPIQTITLGLVLAATETKQRFQISYWDAAIIEAARALRCKVVLTEDLNDGQDYGGVRVENPFERD